MLAVFRYLSRVADNEPEQLLTFAREIGPTAERATMTTAEQIAKEAEERGRRLGREEGRHEGREEGRRLERRELLVKLITLRFGAPDTSTLARLDSASAEQLARSAGRVLDAATLDDVLAP